VSSVFPVFDSVYSIDYLVSVVSEKDLWELLPPGQQRHCRMQSLIILHVSLLIHLQDMCKMATEAISSGQTSVQAELRRTANTRKQQNFGV